MVMANRFKKAIIRLIFWFFVDSNPRSVRTRWCVVVISFLGLLFVGIGSSLGRNAKLFNAFTIMFLILLFGNLLVISVSRHLKEKVKPSETEMESGTLAEKQGD